MRIGICGPSGSGKTTLACELGRILGIPVAREGAREAAQVVGVQTSRSLSPAEAHPFQLAVLQEKLKAESESGSSFVSDRTVIDCAAYWLWREARGLLNGRASDRRAYYRQLGDILSSGQYTLLVLPPSDGIPWVDDSFREEDGEVVYIILPGLIHGVFKNELIASRTRILEIPAELRALPARLDAVKSGLG